MAILTGKRAVLVAPQKPLEIWDRPIQSPKPGEVLLRVRMSGVCGTDVHFFKGEVPLPGPVVLGHEGIATIEELGAGVTTDYAGTPVKVGDRVYWVPIHPCRRCYYCTVAKDFSLCDTVLIDLFRPAAEPPSMCYSEFSVLPEGMAFFRIPDDTPSEAVIAFGCAMPTMLQAMERLGGVTPEQTVVVQGSGPVGLAATLLSKKAGARQVIVIGDPEPRLAMARRLGADETISLQAMQSEDDRLKRVRDLTNGRGAEIVIEAAGFVPAFGQGLKLAAKAGRYLEVGIWSAPGTIPVEPRFINNMNLRIIGSALFQPQHVYGAVQVAQAWHKTTPLADAVTHRFTLSQCQQALDTVARAESIKAVVTPADGS